jgi:DNA-binding SARP family transcriptional activator
LLQTLKCLKPHAQPYLLTGRSTLAFNTTAPYWFDVEAFERQATFGLAGSLPCTEAHRRALEEALDLYRGDLLEGCYDDWCLAERERLQLLLQVLKRLQRHYRFCEAFEAAISCGHRLLALDPLQEDVHRELCAAMWRQDSAPWHWSRSSVAGKPCAENFASSQCRRRGGCTDGSGVARSPPSCKRY